MLQSTPDANGQHVEAVVPRVSAMFSQLMHQNPSNNFYESFVGHLPRERWMCGFLKIIKFKKLIKKIKI